MRCHRPHRLFLPERFRFAGLRPTPRQGGALPRTPRFFIAMPQCFFALAFFLFAVCSCRVPAASASPLDDCGCDDLVVLYRAPLPADFDRSLQALCDAYFVSVSELEIGTAYAEPHAAYASLADLVLIFYDREGREIALRTAPLSDAEMLAIFRTRGSPLQPLPSQP